MKIPLTPLRFKHRAAMLYGEKTGVVCGDFRFTYQQFAERCDRLAQALRVLNVERGSRVAFLAFNCHRLLEAYYGVVQMGAVLLPLNLRLAPEELAFILNDAGAGVLFYDADFVPLVEAMRSRLHTVRHFIALDSAGRRDWSLAKTYEDLIANAAPFSIEEVQIDEDDVAEIFYTSGTTAEPKGVMLTHRNLYLHALSSIIALGIRDTDIQLHSIPLFHVNGWGAPQSLTCMGGTHVMMRRFDPSAALQLIQKERITYTSFVPTMAQALLSHPSLPAFDYSSLRMILIGGAAPSPEMVRQVEARFGCRCYAGYGLTESSPILTIATPKGTVENEPDAERIRRQSMTGWPLIGVALRVVDEQGREVEHDGRHVGEIIAMSDGVMKGYWNRPENEGFRDGWMLTGDMATVDGEGFLQIVDRQKDIIVSGGENIASMEVEQNFYAHPDVLECAVIAVPDPKWGEVPAAFVVLRDGRKTTEEELLQFCRSRLASYKCPRLIRFMESLPKGGTGKILKKELRRSL
jgi:fatty-acyl-CoA synthase